MIFTQRWVISDTHTDTWAHNAVCAQEQRYTHKCTRTQIYFSTQTHTGTHCVTIHEQTHSQPGVKEVGLGVRAEYHAGKSVDRISNQCNPQQKLYHKSTLHALYSWEYDSIILVNGSFHSAWKSSITHKGADRLTVSDRMNDYSTTTMTTIFKSTYTFTYKMKDCIVHIFSACVLLL